MDFLLVIFGLLLLILNINISRTNNIIPLILYMSASSIVITICYLLMDAPDVAMTEAALGACLSTTILLCCGEILKKENFTKHKLSFITLIGCIILGVLMLYAGVDLPSYGDTQTPMHQHINKHFIEHTQKDIGITSFVAAILASYRGYDTLGETTVILTALFSVFCIINTNNKDVTEQKIVTTTNSVILSTITYFITLYIVILGLYIQINGETSPGGGFQSGTILASIIIARSFFKETIDTKYFLYLSIFGLLIYISAGILPLFGGFTFLDYKIFSSNYHTAQKIGIFIIELGIGISIFSSMSALYFLLANFTRKIK